jgi:hypothetical protein
MKQELIEMCCHRAPQIKEVFEANKEYEQFRGKLSPALFTELMQDEDIGLSYLNSCYLATRYMKPYQTFTLASNFISDCEKERIRQGISGGGGLKGNSILS